MEAAPWPTRLLAAPNEIEPSNSPLVSLRPLGGAFHQPILQRDAVALRAGDTPERPAAFLGGLSGDVADLELEAVRVAEEDGVVAGVVVVLGGRVEDLGVEADEQVVDAVDLVAIGGVEREGGWKPGAKRS